ncbi:ABC transporter substrate-binding protein [Marinomonas sp. GJ51-6]|uniref:MlaC/ttg2D family ABC transporter substrate-binding protein n=1 Tax=Marinomonas sp. GJ51-6 TaxID=2992802 RepID=UPI0029342809|nr:ABC transporter substrate-binding protein [Marinomonas sp. GJ51-6]WOD07093.1 ABC transporter substrate-binding protein [Marinomonas sp. GJ51-6]
MNRVLLSVVLFVTMFTSSLSWSNEAAREAVVGIVESFRTDIVADKDILSKDPVLLESRVDNILNKIVDFDDFSKKIMGKYYRRATPEQRTRFVTVTKDTLLKTYGSSLLELDPDNIKVLPLGTQGKGKETRVDVDFQMEAGGLLNITFYMEQSEEEAWMLSNIIINNINFGLTFRKQFSVMMQQNKNDIELAITAWQKSLAKAS